ncbi:MAG: hypothetical protein Q605_AUC00241G0004 [Actinomyces urogenitalis DORA_12]|uniref:Uncharacterized protein n=1 Tax=Actinomyces urogenitalis DORA_12 TaxID=1403939 RepID=W1VPB6_9ACTO|nr:MAG: hypothetical protein Q605_AUC00241G0004 [Actinomyces urogenitalis DORA_12]
MADDFTLAQAEDYTAVYGTPDDDALAGRLDALLARASRVVRDELAADGHDIQALIAAQTVREDTARDVVVDMVAYAIRSASGGFDAPFGASQASQTAGPYTQSATFSVAVGSLSFTRVHRRRLGVAPRTRAWEVDLLASRELP